MQDQRHPPDQRVHFPLDRTLTRENATERGYEWLCDVLLERYENSPALTQRIQIEQGYMLGMSYKPTAANDGCVGLYKPLTSSQAIG